MPVFPDMSSETTGGSAPLIAVTGRCSADGEPFVTVRNTYLNAILESGGIPVVLPHFLPQLEGADHSGWIGHLDRFDGLILSGGEDVDPLQYGAAPHPRLGKIDARRDRFEVSLTRAWLASGKPLFGICRGVQVLNVAAGGTLFQDIPSELPGALDHNPSPDRRAALSHEVVVDSCSDLFGHLGLMQGQAQGGPARLFVNSVHHQSVREVAPGFRAVARADDGVIEAIESIDKPDVWGVQWHPEEFTGSGPESNSNHRRMFLHFVERCRRASGR